MASTPPTDDQLIAAYIQLRDRKDALKAEYDSSVEGVVSGIERISRELATRMKAQGLTGVKSTSGTLSLVVKRQATCNDWGALTAYILQHNRLDFMPRKLNTAPIVEMIEASGEMPPGVSLINTETVSVRRPTR